MRAERLWMALPYAIICAIAAWFYVLAGQIEYTRQGANLGPEFWPRMALGAMMVICVGQFARLLLFGRPGEKPIVTGLDEEEDDAPRSLPLLLGGIALTIAYGASVSIFGFLTANFLFMLLFMYLGRYRGHLAIWLSSFVGSVLLVLLFQKVVYVSLPRGIPPFDRITDLFLGLF
jgi:hypothetical protein